MFLMESCLILSIQSKLYKKRNTKKICSQQLTFVFFSNFFLIGFSLDELNPASISFFEKIIL